MSNETERLTSRQADQGRIDFASIETDLGFMMDRIAGLPTRWELAKLAS